MRQILIDRQNTLKSTLQGLMSPKLDKYGTQFSAQSKADDINLRLDEIRILLKKLPKKTRISWNIILFGEREDAIIGKICTTTFTEIFSSKKFLYGFRVRRAKRRIKKKINHIS